MELRRVSPNKFLQPSKMAPSWHQIGLKNRPKMGYPHRTWSGANMEANNLQTRAKMGPKHPNTNPKTSQNERQSRVPHRTVRWGTPPPCEKNRCQKSTAPKKRAAPHSAPPLEPKKWPTWRQVGLQNRSKIDKKSMQKSIVFLMPLGIDFWVDFGGFGRQNRAKLAPKSIKNRCQLRNAIF